MVKLDKIYTRGGDGGLTSLGDGTRLKKYDVRVAAYGSTDEANAVIGVALCTSTTRPCVPACCASRTICSTSAPICVGPRARTTRSSRCASSRRR